MSGLGLRAINKAWSSIQPVLRLPGLRDHRSSVERHFRSVQNRAYANQRVVTRRTYGVDLKMPSRHPLPQVLRDEPFREQLLRAAASQAFPTAGARYVDVGANIGDTAALVLSVASSAPEILLVEPSEHFLPYLKSNARAFGTSRVIEKFVATSFPIAPIRGSLSHWGGTAQIVSDEEQVIPAECQVDLVNLIDARTRLVKIDCDGQDLAILECSLGRFAKATPMILFENTLSTATDFSQLRGVLDAAASRGYERAVVAHNSGALMYAGSFTEEMWDVFRFQLNMNLQNRAIACYYTDVLLVHHDDEVVFDRVVEIMRSQQSA